MLCIKPDFGHFGCATLTARFVYVLLKLEVKKIRFWHIIFKKTLRACELSKVNITAVFSFHSSRKILSKNIL